MTTVDNIRYWLWLAKIFGTSDNRLWSIISHYDSVEDAYYDLRSGRRVMLSENEASAVKNTDISLSDKVIEYCSRNMYKIITYEDMGYPDRLRGIYNPPSVLFCMGDIKFIDDEVALTIVGTRKPSAYSVKVAKKLCSDLASIGTILISGFAIGIDSQVHSAALEMNTPTVAVLGCGIDFDYPKENSKYKKVIAEKGGAVITEFFPGTKPLAVNFPQRNRIMAGLGLGTVVIEAGRSSGSLITAELALQNGRDVFCIPPADIFDPRYNGCASLIREGAIPVFSYYDIVSEYYSSYTHKIDMSDRLFDVMYADDIYDVPSKQEKKNKKDAEKKTDTKNIDYSALSDLQAAIISQLKNGHKCIDDISDKLSHDIGEIMIAVTELEIMGYIKSFPGNVYSL